MFKTKNRLRAKPLKAWGIAGAIALLATLVSPTAAFAANTDAVASGRSFTLTAPLQGTCTEATWKQVTPLDATSTIAGNTLTITWKNAAPIAAGADVRFTAQLNTPVEGCSISDKGSLTIDGTKVQPYQNDLAAGGANLQVTWRATAVEKPGETETPFNWDWTYPAPTCEGISISFPANLPSSQSGVMEVNVNGEGISGLNWKLEGDAYKAKYPNGHAGQTVFIPWNDPVWRNGVVPTSGEWSVKWIQVHGTNYHWQGEVRCGTKTTPEPPVLPNPKVEYTEWQDELWKCGDAEVTQTRTQTTTPFKAVLHDNEWSVVPDTDNISTVSQSQTRPFTDAEVAECKTTEEPPVVIPPVVDPPVVNPPVVKPPVVEPPVVVPVKTDATKPSTSNTSPQTAADKELAKTGGEVAGPMIGLAATLLALGTGLLLAIRRRRTANQ